MSDSQAATGGALTEAHAPRHVMGDTLLPLRADLERLGYVVVPHGPELCVRLPLLCSVRIGENAGRVRFRAQFGPFGRTGGLLVSSVVSGAAVTTAAVIAGPAVTVAVAFLGVMALAHDACRFVITEGFLTRAQQLVPRSRGPGE